MASRYRTTGPASRCQALRPRGSDQPTPAMVSLPATGWRHRPFGPGVRSFPNHPVTRPRVGSPSLAGSRDGRWLLPAGKGPTAGEAESRPRTHRPASRTLLASAHCNPEAGLAPAAKRLPAGARATTYPCHAFCGPTAGPRFSAAQDQRACDRIEWYSVCGQLGRVSLWFSRPQGGDPGRTGSQFSSGRPLHGSAAQGVSSTGRSACAAGRAEVRGAAGGVLGSFLLVGGRWAASKPRAWG